MNREYLSHPLWRIILVKSFSGMMAGENNNANLKKADQLGCPVAAKGNDIVHVSRKEHRRLLRAA